MSEIEVEVEEIQEFPKVIDPTKMNFIYGSFTSDQQPVERLLSTNESNLNYINVQIVGDENYYSKNYNSNQSKQKYNQKKNINEKKDQKEKKQSKNQK